MVMATGEITASLFWAQSEWAGRRHPASLKSAFLSVAGLASVIVTAAACYPSKLEGCAQCFLPSASVLQITVMIHEGEVAVHGSTVPSTHAAVTTCIVRLHISLKTMRCGCTQLGFCLGPLVAAHATAETALALPKLHSAVACACLSPRNILSSFGQALKDGKADTEMGMEAGREIMGENCKGTRKGKGSIIRLVGAS